MTPANLSVDSSPHTLSRPPTCPLYMVPFICMRRRMVSNG